MMTFIAVCAAGGLGALARSAAGTAIDSRTTGKFHYGIFVINVSGALVLGYITGLAGMRVGGGTERFDVATIVGTGFLGAFTTFSSEEWQTLATYKSGRWLAVRDVGMTLVVSMAAAGFGLWLGTQLK